MSVAIDISKYKNQESKRLNKTGQRAKFKVRPQKPGWIVQSINVDVILDNSKKNYQYTEAWQIISNKKINQSGDDDFLVPNEWIKKHSGSMSIIALAWYQKDLDEDFQEGKNDDLWGRLKGTNDYKTPPSNVPVLERMWIADWKKGKKLKFSSQTQPLKT